MSDRDRRAPEVVPPAVLAAFGSPRARPRLVKAYLPTWGFRRVHPRVRLTVDVALHLQGQGVTEVELAWRWRRRRMTLSPGFRSVWGSPAEGSDAPWSAAA